jgi:hypothetical protein
MARPIPEFSAGGRHAFTRNPGESFVRVKSARTKGNRGLPERLPGEAVAEMGPGGQVSA